jgi:hypothetical protein
MLQRIQTLFLGMVAVTTIILFFVPAASFLSEFHYLKLYLYAIKDMTPQSELQFGIMTVLPLLLVNAGVFLAVVAAVFNYKNRITQIKTVRFALLLSMLLMLGILLFYPNLVSKKLDISAEYEIGAYIPILNLLFLLLANRYIRKDERLVRSADRLR